MVPQCGEAEAALVWTLGWNRGQDKRPVFKRVLSIGQRGGQELRVPTVTVPLIPTFSVLSCSIIIMRTYFPLLPM